MDPDVVRDPVFQALLSTFEMRGRKLRDAVIAMRSFYLKHHSRPLDETTSEKWRGALLSESAAQTHEALVDAAAQLLRYAFEIAPYNNNHLHMEEILKLKLAHERRLKGDEEWGDPDHHVQGIEEKVTVDGGVPLTLVIKPKYWEFTEKGKQQAARKKPAIPPEQPESSEPDPSE